MDGGVERQDAALVGQVVEQPYQLAQLAPAIGEVRRDAQRRVELVLRGAAAGVRLGHHLGSLAALRGALAQAASDPFRRVRLCLRLVSAACRQRPRLGQHAGLLGPALAGPGRCLDGGLDGTGDVARGVPRLGQPLGQRLQGAVQLQHALALGLQRLRLQVAPGAGVQLAAGAEVARAHRRQGCAQRLAAVAARLLQLRQVPLQPGLAVLGAALGRQARQHLAHQAAPLAQQEQHGAEQGDQGQRGQAVT